MNRQNLHDFFIEANLDISEFVIDPFLLSIQIIYLYFIIKDWYIKGTFKSILLYNQLITYKNDIYNIDTLSEIYGITRRSYIALLENISNKKVNTEESLIDYIDYLKNKDICYYSIYIHTDTVMYVLFIFHRYNICLLINVHTLTIIEFKSINECIHHINCITNHIYDYQVMRVINRYFGSDITCYS